MKDLIKKGLRIMAEQQDLGVGSVKKLLFRLAIPAVVGQVVNLLYNIIDRIYIGHMPDIGGKALTGVGLFTPILMLLTAFAMLAGSGGAPLAAIAMGKKDKDKAEKIMANCFTLLLIFSAVLTVVFYFAAPALLDWFGASSDTLPYAVEYGRIYIFGTIAVQIVMGMNPFLTTQGFAKMSMLTTVIGAGINIILDPIFIFVLNLGVTGAALATVLSQLISAIWILRFLTGRQTILKLKISNMPLKRTIILPCLGLGVSSFVMIATESILSISFTSSLSKFGGDVAVGAMTVLTSLMQLVSMPLTGVCQGGQPLISYNYGAKKYERVRSAFFWQFGICIGYTVAFWLLLMLVPQVFAGIFTGDKVLVDYAADAIRIYMAGVFAMGAQMSCQQAFVALGQAKVSLFMACLRKIILLIPLIFILPIFFTDKAMAVFLAEPIADIVAAAVTTTMFFRFFKKMDRIPEKKLYSYLFLSENK